MGDAQKGPYLDPRVLKQIMDEKKLIPASLARRLCRVEYRRGRAYAGESWEDYFQRRKDAARQLVGRKSDHTLPISSTDPKTADNIALALAAELPGPPGDTAWEEAERRAQDYLGRMLTEADCVGRLSDKPVPPKGGDGPSDGAAQILHSMVKEARAIANVVREYVDDEGAPLDALLRAGTPPDAHNPAWLSRLWEVLKESGAGRTDGKQIDDAVRAARKDLNAIEAARRRYQAELRASASLNESQGFTADTMQQYAADCRLDAEFADALGRSDEAARVRDFAKRYEAYGRLLGAIEPLKETIALSIDRDVRHTDALHRRLEAAFGALTRKAALALTQGDSVRRERRTDRDKDTTKSDD